MSHNRSTSHRHNPSNLTLPQPINTSTQNTAPQTAKQHTTTIPNNDLVPTTTSSTKPNPLPLPLDLHVNPQEIATNRARASKARLATAHEGWTLAAQFLVRRGIIPADAHISREMKEFGEAVCGRYAEASLLWGVLGDMKGEDWFGGEEGGNKEMFEATVRRLGTLRGLEGSLAVWEGVVLGLVDMLGDGKDGGGDGKGEGEGTVEKGEGLGSAKRQEEQEVVEKVKELLGWWREGLPSEP